MKPWEMWKQTFNTWETTTSRYLENVMSNPAVLNPAAALLTAATKVKAVTDRAASQWWAMLGLPTRVDQERSLHKLNQLESRLLDLEEQLAAPPPRAPRTIDTTATTTTTTLAASAMSNSTTGEA
jgi:hypothetical protein